MRVIQFAKNGLMRMSRERKLQHFYSLMKEGQSVLDVGVSQETPHTLREKPMLNYFLKTYRFPPDTYTGLGVEDMTGMAARFPGKRFVQYSGGPLPFPDKSFDWVFSNAVIEHVGDDDEQLLFLNELMRVGKNAFLTTPNKHFPVESHTGVVFIHWNDRLFYRWCAAHAFWTEKNLRLISRRNLNHLMNNSAAQSFVMYRNRVAGMTMTLTVVCSDNPSGADGPVESATISAVG
jgi:SAM-dependent methyltransferase